ncbi:HDIG domain-containing protein [Nocardioides sp. KC13]|uniref:HDIG domain-containing protein n=1 Tax=Nocardioides turkmenicus TaxID=2711220 RepID=A0A6M1QXZ6_9ACTN|nr:HDIG domain-containing metalloprotein [Nocardioides sp. KC13]NGN91291.1 HDIG domain-containing protein [Nocardioides sp. KC13]
MLISARSEARQFVEPLGRRWLHVQAVADSAIGVADKLGLDSETLVAAAWLHDIGYADELRGTGFHPVDGARYLRRTGWNEEVVRLVAHHSCSRFEAGLRGMSGALGEFPRPSPDLEDALCFCDMTTGPGGERVTVVDRLAEIQARYGEGDVVGRFVEVARGDIVETVRRIEDRLLTAE